MDKDRVKLLKLVAKKTEQVKKSMKGKKRSAPGHNKVSDTERRFRAENKLEEQLKRIK